MGAAESKRKQEIQYSVPTYADSPRSIIAALCDADGVSYCENVCLTGTVTLCAKLEQVMSKDSVAVLRGREFTVERSPGALESDWQLVFGAQVQIDKDGFDRVECYQVSSRTRTYNVDVKFLQKCNADLFQAATAHIPIWCAVLLF